MHKSPIKQDELLFNHVLWLICLKRDTFLVQHVLRGLYISAHSVLDAIVSIGPSLCSVTDGHHFLSN